MHSISWLQKHWHASITVLREASLVIQNSATPTSLLDTQAFSHNSAAQDSSLAEVGLGKQHGRAAWVIQVSWLNNRTAYCRERECTRQTLTFWLTLIKQKVISCFRHDFHLEPFELRLPLRPTSSSPFLRSEIQPFSATTSLGNNLRRVQGQACGAGITAEVEGVHVLE